MTTHRTFPRLLVSVTATACALLALPLATPAVAQTTRVTIGSTAAASSDYVYYVTVSRLINQHLKNIESNVIETGASLDNVRRMANRQIDLGLVTTNIQYQAFNGTGAFEGKPVKTRMLWVYALSPQNVVVREDSGVKTLAELAGKRFNPGIRGSGTEKTAEGVLAALNIKPDFVRGSTGDMVAGIKDNRLIGYVKGGMGDASIMDLASATRIRVLDLNASERAKIRATFPDLSIVDVPAGATPGLPGYSTWGFGTATAASPELPEAVAYAMVKVVNENLAAQQAAYPGLKQSGMSIADLTLKYSVAPLHPGAIRYYREIGKTIPPNLQ